MAKSIWLRHNYQTNLLWNKRIGLPDQSVWRGQWLNEKAASHTVTTSCDVGCRQGSTLGSMILLKMPHVRVSPFGLISMCILN